VSTVDVVSLTEVQSRAGGFLGRPVGTGGYPVKAEEFAARVPSLRDAAVVVGERSDHSTIPTVDDFVAAYALLMPGTILHF
jgi:hypothetical protein